MKKKRVYFLVLTLLGVFSFPQADMHAQVLRKPLPVAQQAKATIASVTPRSVALKQGGSAQVIVVEGKFLETILAAQVIRGGQNVRVIEAKLVQPWPASRKIELQAGANAPVRPGYQLRAIGQAGPNAFKIDVPLAVFSLEVAGNKLHNLQKNTLPAQALSPLPQSGFPLTQMDLRNIKDIYKALGDLEQLSYRKAYVRSFQKELHGLEQFLAKERMTLSLEERRALLVLLEDIRKRLENEMEAIRNQRQEFQTMFENFNQKATQLFNLLETVMKSINEMKSQAPRNLL